MNRQNGRITLTYSAMQAFLTCPRKYYWRYVQEVEPNQVFRVGQRVRILTVSGTSRVAP